uniref:Uncharacterized protein n=1 Tax=Arundo donax TaxID=35708 RepID=A0A0A9FB69_ARUDO
MGSCMQCGAVDVIRGGSQSSLGWRPSGSACTKEECMWCRSAQSNKAKRVQEHESSLKLTKRNG